MKKYVIWVAATTACLAAQSAMADGNKLLKECREGIVYVDGGREPENLFGVGQCMGVIQGTIDTLDLTHALLNSPKIVCLPSGGLETLQVMKIVVKYLNEHPDRLHLNESGLISTALMVSFPCLK
ncbi:Rap1a/Tai family immunity protein [Pseudomonas sp. 11/12A]|uniref:Rap1a/Tai family immunity protein n=1 Tax=Pseudomonas sp. 11/12A TaxID=1506582 RepID=UPI000646FC9D|nr:Rap1a/Tai family immunity protein [Pseudomonas sp. 11/12A]